MLGLGPGGEGQPIAVVIAHVAPLAEAISETVHSGDAGRTTPASPGREAVTHRRHASRRWSAPTASCRLRCACSPTSPEVVELEEQLRLKEALAGVGEMTAGLAHEFRNGLATIHG